MPGSINDILSEIYSKLHDKEVTEASMLAEEVLGDTFSQWRKHDDDATACELIAASCAYAAVMQAMNRDQEAYAACMTALAYTARKDVEPQGVLALCLLSWQILERTLSSTQPAEQAMAKKHVETITSALGTLLYHHYYATGKADPDNGALDDAYQALRVITQLTDIDTHMDSRLPYISRILQSSEAIGLLQ